MGQIAGDNKNLQQSSQSYSKSISSKGTQNKVFLRLRLEFVGAVWVYLFRQKKPACS